MLPNISRIQNLDSSISKHLSDYHDRYCDLISRLNKNEFTDNDCIALENSLSELLAVIILGEIMPTITQSIAQHVDVNTIDIPTYQIDEIKKMVAHLSSLSMDAILSEPQT